MSGRSTSFGLHLSLGRGRNREAVSGEGSALSFDDRSPHPRAARAGLSQGRGGTGLGPRALLLMLITAAAVFSSPARAQVSGTVDWSTLGFADEAALTSGTTATSAGVTTTMTWSSATDGGSFIAYEGANFVSYESNTQGGFAGYAQIGFDNERQDADDKITVNLTFSEAVTNLEFTITDVDEFGLGRLRRSLLQYGLGLRERQDGDL